MGVRIPRFEISADPGFWFPITRNEPLQVAPLGLHGMRVLPHYFLRARAKLARAAPLRRRFLVPFPLFVTFPVGELMSSRSHELSSLLPNATHASVKVKVLKIPTKKKRSAAITRIWLWRDEIRRKSASLTTATSHDTTKEYPETPCRPRRRRRKTPPFARALTTGWRPATPQAHDPCILLFRPFLIFFPLQDASMQGKTQTRVCLDP